MEQGAVYLPHLARSRAKYGVFVLFMWDDVGQNSSDKTAVVHAECYATGDSYKKTGINRQQVGVGSHFEVHRGRG